MKSEMANKAMQLAQAVISPAEVDLLPLIPLMPSVSESFARGKLVETVVQTKIMLSIHRPFDHQPTVLANLIPLLNKLA